jgi:hypothetical protein
LWWAGGDVMGKHFFSQSCFFKICVIYHRGRRSVQHSCCSKNYKTYEFSKISFWHTSKIILIKNPPIYYYKIYLKKNFFSLWWHGDVMGKHSQTFFSQSFFFKIGVIYPRGFSPVHSSTKLQNLSSHSFIHCRILQK